MKESGLTVEKSAEKGAIRKTKYKGTMQMEKRVKAELKKKKEDEEWLKECKGEERQMGEEEVRPHGEDEKHVGVGGG